MITITMNDGRRFSAETPALLVRQLNLASFEPEATDQLYMEAFAARVSATTKGPFAIRASSPEDFLMDLITLGIAKEDAS